MKNISLFIAAYAIFIPSTAYANEAQLERFVEARLLEINNENASALKGYDKLFSQQSNSEILLDRLFEIALQEGDVKTALKAIDTLEINDALPIQAHILRYSNALKNKNWNAASATLIAIKADPVFGFMAPIMESWIDSSKGNDGTILLDTEKNAGLTNFYARDQILYQYLALKKYDEVIETIVAIRPFNAAFARDLILKSAPILARNGREDFAYALLRAQGSGAALSFLSIIEKGEQGPSYSDEISANIGIARLYVRVSETLIDQEIFDQAVFFARTAMWLAPNDPVVAIQLAAALAANGQIDAANILFDSANASDPYYSIFASQNIRILLDEERGDEAIIVAKRANKERPNSQTLMLLLAQTFESVDQYAEAADVYAILLKNTDEDQKLRQSYLALYQARSLERADKWDESKIILEKGLALKVKNPFLLNFYGYSLLNRGEDIERGFDLVKRAHRLEPNSPDITDSLGWGYFLQGDLKKALPLLEEAANISKQDSEIQEHLGDAYWTLGRLVDARYIWRTASIIADDKDKSRLDHKAEYGLDIPYIVS